MADLSVLEANVVKLEAVVPRVLAALAAPGVDQAAIDALAGRVDAQASALDAAVPVV